MRIALCGLEIVSGIEKVVGLRSQDLVALTCGLCMELEKESKTYDPVPWHIEERLQTVSCPNRSSTHRDPHYRPPVRKAIDQCKPSKFCVQGQLQVQAQFR
jgi:hypothetical protein